jgi:RNA polymerase sigma-70 factor (ECF subfamily)
MTQPADQARAVWDAHFRPLAGYCASVLADADLGRDIAAEAFVRLWSRWTSVQDPRGFLYVVATNLCRDHWRRAGRERRAVRAVGESLVPVAAVDPWLRDLVDRLPEKHRRPVLLHYYADLPVVAVASALNRPVGTVKRHLAEARALLATSIEESS